MVSKDSRRPLVFASLLLSIAIGISFPVYAGEDQSPTRFIELDLVVSPGSVEIDRSEARSLHLLSLNLNRFFDNIDDGNKEKVVSNKKFNQRIHITAEAFAERFKLPDIIALQEVENRNVLHQLAAAIRQRYFVAYQTVLIEGQDVSGIDVGYLVRADLQIRHSAALFTAMRTRYDDIPLFSRPPLQLDVCRLQTCFTLLNLHLRSMRGINSEKKGERVARKRRQQAEAIAAWSHRWQQKHPRGSLILLGDLNALTPSDRHVDVVGIIRGNPDNRLARLPGKDLLDPDLVDLTLEIPANQRYSFVFRGRQQQLDYMLVNQSFGVKLDLIAFARIDRDLSDHAGLFARFSW